MCCVQEEYSREKINWQMIEFNDNQACLDLINKKPMGIFQLLDEECNFPRVNMRMHTPCTIHLCCMHVSCVQCTFIHMQSCIHTDKILSLEQ